jgi:hypothetical protein
MSTSMVDLSSLQTVNFGNGVSGYYDPTSGTYYDSGGNVLSASDLSQYGAFTVSSGGAAAPAPTTTPAAPTPTPVSPTGSAGSLSGLSGLFSSIGGAIVNATRPPTIQTPAGQTLVYNPATGGYTTTTALTASSVTSSPLIMFAILAVVLLLIFEEGK